MPLFRKFFSPKKCPLRKSLPFNSQTTEHTEKEIKLKLGDQELIFEGGKWKPGNQTIFRFTFFSCVQF